VREPEQIVSKWREADRLSAEGGDRMPSAGICKSGPRTRLSAREAKAARRLRATSMSDLIGRSAAADLRPEWPAGAPTRIRARASL
jgi:hypothetical protein